MSNPAWMADFEFNRDHMRVRKTGAVVPYSLSVTAEFLSWLVYFLALTPLRLRALSRSHRPRVAFAPDRARPWYLLWAAVTASGARIVRTDAACDVLVFFDDRTASSPPQAPAGVAGVNLQCRDVSKSRVAAVFESVFGYGLALDPETHVGPAVEKGEDNGVHDGRVVTCPLPAQSGKVYQRLIDTKRPDGLVEDIRCPTVNGRIPVVFLKRRETERRFANANAEVVMTDADSVLSADEQARLAAFCRAMHLEWGGLDVLRDRHDGRIYVVDVNKTDMGPPTALALRDKLAATRRLAEAFRTSFFDNSGDRRHGL